MSKLPRDWWVFEDATDDEPPEVPAASAKRPRGRPRHPSPQDWLRNPPSWVTSSNIGMNITDETLRQYREDCEEHRRGKVSEKVVEAYRSGRNTANKNRASAKEQALSKVKHDNAKVISTSGLSPSAIAKQIVRVRRNHGLGWRAIFDEISSDRKGCEAK